MNPDQVIKEVVTEFIDAKKMFTSVDIGNEIKREKKVWIRNREVAAWLRASFFIADPIFNEYTQTMIEVDDDTYAFLYHHEDDDYENYDGKCQHALTPQEADIDLNKQQTISIQNQMIAGKTKTVSFVSMMKPVTKNDAEMESIISYSEKVRIPACFIKKLGWKAGDDVITSKIHACYDLPSGLKVHDDNRVYIPKNCFSFKSSIKVTLKNDELFLTSA